MGSAVHEGAADHGPRSLVSLPRNVAQLAALDGHQTQFLALYAVSALIDAATDDELRAHPYALMQLVRALDPCHHIAERASVLDRLVELLGPTGNPPWLQEVEAERALDFARTVQLDEGEFRARALLATTSSSGAFAVAHARAAEALGRALAWRGTEHASREADKVLRGAAEEYGRLKWTDSQGFALFWAAYTVTLQWGDLDAAETQMRAGLALVSPGSPRRGVMLSFLADVLIDRGKWADVSAVLDEAAGLALSHEDAIAKAYVSWSRARAASMRGDAGSTARALVETDRYAGDRFTSDTAATFLSDAAEMLDRVGDHRGADEYLARATEQAADHESVRQGRALLLARRGDPVEALEALRLLPRAPWLERRLLWRYTLFAAYATLRARLPGAGQLAARAFTEASTAGGTVLTRSGEAAISATLAPLAALTGSVDAHELLAPEGGFVVRLVGDVAVSRAGLPIDLPPGLPAALVRLLALHPRGLDADEAIDALWPEATTEVGRRQLRDVRSRLQKRVGAIVVRQGSRLRLDAEWVDFGAFGELADRALASRGERANELALAALAIATGELLPTDPYATWAIGPREAYRRRRLAMLDLLTAAAVENDRLEEACLLLDEAIGVDPYGAARYHQAADHLTALGRREAARQQIETAAARLAELGVTKDRRTLSR